MHVAIDGDGARQMPALLRFGMALGMTLPVYGSTALVAAIVWARTKKPNTAMWTWTVMLLVVIAVLGVGGARMMADP